MTLNAGLSGATPDADPGQYDAFLSYGRIDRAFAVDGRDATGRPTAMPDGWRGLREELRARGLKVWVDLEDIPVGSRWEDRVSRAIEACKAFIFVMSAESLSSEPCARELAFAKEFDKLVIPVVYQDTGDHPIPAALREREWVFLRQHDERAAAMELLARELTVDLAWRDRQTVIAGRMREWRDRQRQPSYLLRGAALRAAEDWMGTASTEHLAPTAEQREYIVASRRSGGRRQRMAIAGLGTALAIAFALVVYAISQHNSATKEAERATSATKTANGEVSFAGAAHLVGGGSADSGPVTQEILTSLSNYERAPTRAALDAVVAAASLPLEHTLGAPHPVTSLAFSPSGGSLAAGDEQGDIIVYDAASGAGTNALSESEQESVNASVDALAYSPSGTTLAAGDFEGQTILLDTADQAMQQNYLPGEPGVNSLAFSPDGTVLASGDVDGVVGLLASATATTLSELRDPSTVNAVAFSPNGTTLATGDSSGQVVLYDRAKRTSRTLTAGGSVSSLSFSRNGDILAMGDSNGSVILEDLATGATRRLEEGSAVTGVAFDRSGTTLAIGDQEGDLLLYTISTGGTVELDLGGPITALAFSPSGDTLATSVGDRIYLWSFSIAARMDLSFAAPVQSIGFSPDSHALDAVESNGRLDLDSLLTGAIRTFTQPSVIDSAAFTDDGEILATGGADPNAGLGEADGRVVLHNLRTGTATTLSDNDGGAVQALASGDGDALAAGTADGELWIYNARTQQGFGVSANGAAINDLAFRPTGRSLATAVTEDSPDGGASTGGLVFDSPSTGEEVSAIDDASPLDAVAFSPNGAWVATGDSAGHVRLRNLLTMATKLWRFGSPVNSVAFSPAGRRVAVGLQDGGLIVEDLATRTRITLATGGPVLSVSFSPDGKWLAAGEYDDEVSLYQSILWTEPFDVLRGLLCEELRIAPVSSGDGFDFNIPQPAPAATCPL